MVAAILNFYCKIACKQLLFSSPALADDLATGGLGDGRGPVPCFVLAVF